MSIYQRFTWADCYASINDLLLSIHKRPEVARKAAWVVVFDRTQDRLK